MKKFSLLSVLVTIFALAGPAVGQYAPQPPPRVGVPNSAAGDTSPGYRWREQRLNEDLRRNGSAGQLLQQPPNNTIGSGSVGLTNPNIDAGECAKGFSEETCQRRGQKYIPQR